MNKTWGIIVDTYFNTLITDDYIESDKINEQLYSLIEGNIYQAIGKREAESFEECVSYILHDPDFKNKTAGFKKMYVENQRDYYKTLI